MPLKDVDRFLHKYILSEETDDVLDAPLKWHRCGSVAQQNKNGDKDGEYQPVLHYPQK